MNVNYKKDSNKIITLFSLFKSNEFGILFKDKLKEPIDTTNTSLLQDNDKRSVYRGRRQEAQL